MKVIKVLALVLLGFVLFLSLSVLGTAFTLNSTVLNPDFYAREMDRVDITSLAEEPISDFTAEAGLSVEFRAALLDAVSQIEPLAKEQVAAAIRPVLDYLGRRSQSLDLASVLGDTVLDPEFIVSLTERVDVPALAGELLAEEIAQEVPLSKSELVAYAKEVMAEIEPWLRQQIAVIARPLIDYMLGKSPSLNVVISLQPLTDGLRTVFLRSPPSELSGLTQPQLQQYFDDNVRGLMPATFEVNEDLVGPDVPSEMARALAEAESGLAEARVYVGYFKLGYWLLIVFVLLLVAGFALISWQVRRATRGLGIIFLVAGIVFIAGNLVARYFIGGFLGQQPDVPAGLHLLQLVGDSLAPLAVYGIVLAAIGVGLLVASFIFKPRQAG